MNNSAEGNNPRQQEYYSRNYISDGYYYIINKVTGKCIDINGGCNENGTQIITWDLHRGKNQRWKIKYNEAEDIYYIESVCSKKVLDGGTEIYEGKRLHQWEYLDLIQQKWRLIKENDGFIKIQSMLTNLFLEEKENQLLQESKNNTDNQVWFLITCEFVKAINYHIINKGSGKCIDLDNGNNENKTPIIVWDLHGGKNQQWRFEYNEKENIYVITSVFTNKCIDNGCFSQENSIIHQWDKLNLDQQKWRVIHVSEKYFKIQSLFNNYFLEVQSNRLIQMKEKKSESQLWFLEPTKNVDISLIFSLFELKVSHPLIESVGKFGTFCLRMFRDGCSLEDISSVTGMEIELIKKQLEFVVSRKYLSSEMKLTDLGDHLLSIQDFLVECGRSKPIFAMEHYIENPEEKKNILLSLINNKQILVNYCQ